MTKTSLLYATALAIGLATPAAAVTFIVDVGTTTFHIEGVTPTGPLDDNGLNLRPHVTLLPEPPKAPGGIWEYMITERSITTSPILGDVTVFGGCYPCDPESVPWSGIHGDGLLTFQIQWWAAGVFAGLQAPQFQLDFALPEGVTLTHMPLPASWVMLASMLGLGGLFRWARRRVAVS